MNFETAAIFGFPRFTRTIDQSTPENSSPYVVPWALLNLHSFDPRRRELLTALGSALSDLRSSAIAVDQIIIGGSFLNLSAVPRDLDAVLYYRCESARPDGLTAWCARWKEKSLDLRMVPVDAGSDLLIRMTSYFTMLYCQSRVGVDHLESHGLLLVVDVAEAGQNAGGTA